MADINYSKDSELYLIGNNKQELEEINKHIANLQKLFLNLEVANLLDLENVNDLKEVIKYLKCRKNAIECQDIEEKIDFESKKLHF